MSGSAYRSHSTTTYAARTNTTNAAPAGIQDGDVLYWSVVRGNSGSAPATPTWPSGFSLVTMVSGANPQTVNDGGYYVTHWLLKKVASGESGDYTALHANGASQGLMVAVSGSDGTIRATRDYATGIDYGRSSTITAPGLTTGADSSYVAFLTHNWDLYGSGSPPTGSTPTFTERVDSATSLMYLADGVLATAGATGNKSHTNPGNAFNPWQALLIEVRAAAGGGGGFQSLTPGFFTNTGTFYAATITRGAVSLSPALVTNSQSFYSPTITTGAVALTPSVFTNTQAFYSATITQGGVALLPSLLTNTPSFYSATIVVGAIGLTPSLVTNTSVFYNAVVTQGEQIVQPSRVDNTSTFFSGTVVVGSVSLLPTRLDNTSSFFSAIVSQDAQIVLPGLVSNTSTFYTASVSVGTSFLLPTTFLNNNIFYNASVMGGTVNLLRKNVSLNSSTSTTIALSSNITKTVSSISSLQH